MHKLNLNKYLLTTVSILLAIPMLLLSVNELTIKEIQELQEAKLGEAVIKEEEKFLEIQTSAIREDEEEECKECIYGYELFNDIPTTFALSSNVPIPQDYTLGPGDKLKIEYFGNNKDKKDEYITRNGNIKLPLLGPINIAGQSMQAAERLISKKVSEELIGTEVYLSLGELRSINVYLVGAAYKPGTYTVSSLASLTNVIFSTGGPDKVGSLRNIQVKRNGSLIQTYDFYKLLLEGDTSQNLRLQEGDTIFYPLIDSLIRIDGSVQRPGNYEILPTSALSEIIKFSGLLNKNDLKLQFSRFNKTLKMREVKILSDPVQWNGIKLKNGDSINILRGSKQNQVNVLLSGEFLYPGYYDISAGQTISEIITQAGGLSELAYPEGAVFTREAVKKQDKISYALFISSIGTLVNVPGKNTRNCQDPTLTI